MRVRAKWSTGDPSKSCLTSVFRKRCQICLSIFGRYACSLGVVDGAPTAILAAAGHGLIGGPPMTREVAYSGQVALDVAAIVAGMTRAHGAQEVASLPKWWRDFLSLP